MSIKSISDLLNDNAFQNIKNSSSSSREKYENDTFDFLTLIENWHEIIGDKFAKYTIPLKIRYGTLTILSNHSAFAQHLGFLEEQIKLKIIEHYPSLKGKINSVNFQNNPRYFDQQKKAHKRILKENPKEKRTILHKYSPEYKALEKKALEIFSDIDDQEIKDSLISIYIQKNHFNN